MEIVYSKKIQLLFVFLFLPFCLLSYACSFSADDFLFLSNIRDFGFWESQKHMYLTWVGRYSSTFFISAFSSFLSPFLSSLFLFLCSFLALYFFLKSLSLNQKPLPLTILVFSVYLSGLLSLTETFYWLVGGMTYQLALILILFLFTLLNHYSKKTNIVLLLAMFLLSGIVVGMNESIMVFLVGLSIINICLCFFEKKTNSFIKGWISILIGAGLGSLLVFFAPGNEMRMNAFPESHLLVSSLIKGAIYFLRYLFIKLSSLSLWGGTIFFIPFILEVLKKNGRRFFSSRFFSLGVLLYFLFVLPFWCMGAAPALRLYTVYDLAFYSLWFFGVGLFFSFYAQESFLFENITIKKMGLVFTLVGLISSANMQNVFYDLSYFKAHYQKNQERLKQIEISTKEGREEIILPAYDIKMRAVLFSDIGADKNHWINKEYARYLNVKSVRLETAVDK